MEDDKSLLYACVIDDLDLIRERLKNVTPSQLSKSSQKNGTPLHAAALSDNRQAVDLLLMAGANLEAGNFLHNNAMLACIEAGKLDMARYLLEKGSVPTRKGLQNRNALSQLILYSWDRDFAEYLLALGLDVNATALDKQNLLMDAASGNNPDAINFLLEYGIDRSHENSALCWGIIHNAVDAVKLLLDSGTNLDQMYAACKGIEKGLYHTTATRENRGDLIRLLLSRGCDFTKAPQRQVVVGIDRTKLSPLDYARDLLQRWPTATHIKDNIAIIENV